MGRRRFLSHLSAATAGVVAASQPGRNEGAQEPRPTALPTIRLGEHVISRLVVGANPICGYSYLGRHTDRHMREYFTVDRTVEFLRSCERAGITAHQYSPAETTTAAVRALQESGSRMRFVCLHSGKDGVDDIVKNDRPIALVHHGGVTDRLFAAGRSEEVHDYVKAAHDRGVLAGVSAHNPDCIRRIAHDGWEVDFFMTCFYFLTRKTEASHDARAPSILPLSYNFYAEDPAAMTEVVREVPKPCLGFKILAAGRKCMSQESVRAAFRFAFEHIKPTDGVIVGMYPRFEDEISANVGYAREFSQQS